MVRNAHDLINNVRRVAGAMAVQSVARYVEFHGGYAGHDINCQIASISNLITPHVRSGTGIVCGGHLLLPRRPAGRVCLSHSLRRDPAAGRQAHFLSSRAMRVSRHGGLDSLAVLQQGCVTTLTLLQQGRLHSTTRLCADPRRFTARLSDVLLRSTTRLCDEPTLAGPLHNKAV